MTVILSLSVGIMTNRAFEAQL